MWLETKYFTVIFQDVSLAAKFHSSAVWLQLIVKSLSLTDFINNLHDSSVGCSECFTIYLYGYRTKDAALSAVIRLIVKMILQLWCLSDMDFRAHKYHTALQVSYYHSSSVSSIPLIWSDFLWMLNFTAFVLIVWTIWLTVLMLSVRVLLGGRKVRWWRQSVCWVECDNWCNFASVYFFFKLSKVHESVL